MRDDLATLMAAFVIAATSGTACAMSPPDSGFSQCRVIAAEKLPEELGGGDAICAAISRAAEEQAAGVGYEVEVRVLSPYSLAAAVKTADGRSLPEQRMAISDRELSTSSIERFARAIAATLAKSGS